MLRSNPKITLATVALVVCTIAPTRTADDPRQVNRDLANRVLAHMEFLADDLLEGRAAGTRGYDVAARYVATALRTSGFEPAGDRGTFFQAVPLRQSRRTAAALALIPRGGARIALNLPDEAVLLPHPLETSVEVTAPAVFVGFGVTAPERQYDDYARVDARGKIVVAFTNAPSTFPSELRAHYSSYDEKLGNALRHGAVAVLLTALPEELKRYPWDFRRRFMDQPQMVWLAANGETGSVSTKLKAIGVVGPAGAEKLFASSPTPLAELHAAGERGTPTSFDLPLTIHINTTTEHTAASSANVVGRLRGRDDVLASSHVVLTAHLDHEGISTPVNGDAIYNGAFDNAAGCAVLLEVARTIAAAPTPPLRSVLIVFVTAEEKGLLGSDYFARNPTVPAASLVANVNLDMPLLQWPMKDVVAFGAENSTLKGVVERAIRGIGLELAPDPMPAENVFVRSDQYSLVKQGVPAVFLVPGFTSSDPAKDGGKVFREFLATHYHKPSDDLSLPIDREALATFTRANYLVTMAIANDKTAPRWNKGNFFGEKYGRR